MKKSEGSLLTKRFWAKVKKRKSGCWEWIGSTRTSYGGKHHYGCFRVNYKLKQAHHVAWFIYTGKWPTKKILHICDNPICVRQEHLYEGTQLDNMRDRHIRGRTAKGEQHYEAVLTEAKVRVIRLSHLPDNIWAKKFGVSKSTIGAARVDATWNHIKNPPPRKRYKV